MSAEPEEKGLERGAALIDAGRAEEALEPLAAAAASDPEDERAQCLLALALIAMGRHAQALAAAERAVAIAPQEEWCHRLRAIALLKLDRGKQAVAAAQEAVRLEPELAEPHSVLAQAQAERKRLPEARTAALTAAELAPDDPHIHVILGDIALEAGSNAAAEWSYRTALRMSPEDALAHNNLGVALLRQGRRGEANEAFTAAARLDPRQGESAQNVAMVARDFVTRRGWAVAIAALACLQVVRLAANELDGAVAVAVIVGALVAAVVGLVLFQRHRERQLAPHERALLVDQRARYRRRPWKWRPQRVLVPWQIWILVRIPPPLTLALAVLLMAMMLAHSGGYGTADWVVFAVVATVASWAGLRTRRLWLRRRLR